jgi:hypothetical protein
MDRLCAAGDRCWRPLPVCGATCMRIPVPALWCTRPLPETNTGFVVQETSAGTNTGSVVQEISVGLRCRRPVSVLWCQGPGLDTMSNMSDSPNRVPFCRAVIIMAATNRPESVDRALRRPGRFDKEFEIGAPSPSARRSMLHSLLSHMSHDIPERHVHDVADSLHGFVAADIAAVCQEAALIVLRQLARGHLSEGRSVKVDLAALTEAATVVRPSGMREVAVEINKVLFFHGSTVVCYMLVALLHRLL